TPHNKWLGELIEKKADLLHSGKLKPFFASRFFVKTDRLTKKYHHLKNTADFKEDTLTFKALVFTTWADHMKI
ncbi:MAG TPA: hypothetical protein VKG26_08585, partial [Bacteroidia bacterium]|nr:hypothetical protein [Bacteroidia bacterium]